MNKQGYSHSPVPPSLALESEADMIANVVILGIIAILVFFSVRKIYTDRKNGVHSCSGGCAGCSGSCSHTHLSDDEVQRRQARLKHSIH
jgi:hypothetical protein